MSGLGLRYFLLITLIAACLLVVGIWSSRTPQQANASSTLALQPPPFARTREAAASASASFLVEEAGITAHANLSQTIRLNYVQSAFRTIEVQSEDYLIGSVPVPDYPIEYDAHAYVHCTRTAGWSPTTRLLTRPARSWTGRTHRTAQWFAGLSIEPLHSWACRRSLG